tara:strand:+ start:511 stop:1074 length:564 start_codon:yes stop_codon:yes gene_type:complete
MSVIKPKDLNAEFLKKIEDKYGKVNMKHDFFSDDLKTYLKTYKVESEEEGGGIGHKVIKLPSFQTLYNTLEKAKEEAHELSIHKDMRNDDKFKTQSNNARDTFNSFRTYFRKNYPDQYAMVSRKIDETIKEASTTSGGPGYNTPYAFLRPGSKPNDSQYTSIGYTPVNRKALRKKSKGVDFIDLYKS